MSLKLVEVTINLHAPYGPGLNFEITTRSRLAAFDLAMGWLERGDARYHLQNWPGKRARVQAALAVATFRLRGLATPACSIEELDFNVSMRRVD